MRVLHITGGDLGGGAARGALWLHEALRGVGIASTLAVQRAKEPPPGVVPLEWGLRARLQAAWHRQRNKLPLRPYLHRKRLFNSGLYGLDITTHPRYADADLLHLHWIPSGVFGLDGFRRVRKPIIWTLRDMWPFTGGCHYTLGCTRYETGCGDCPMLGSRRRDDLSRRLFESKRHCYNDTMHPVAISRWLGEAAGRSPLMQGRKLQVIPNGVDVETFSPMDREQARRRLGLPLEGRIILTGAQHLDDTYKGNDKVIELLPLLRGEEISLVTFGRLEADSFSGSGVRHHHLGYVTSDGDLRAAYSAADLFLAPSLQEAFGKTLIEAMGCATPVVCFDATGPAEIVEHRQTGFKARPFEAADLARGIRWALEDEERLLALGRRARARVEERYDIKHVARAYVRLYEEVLSGSA